ncbi:DUF6215 domain-containing protein [Streptomyces phaeoluteigriseus]
MAEDLAVSEKHMSTGAQVVAAVVAVGGLAALMWGLNGALPGTDPYDEPATCSEASAAPAKGHVSGAQLCTALNRPDLAALLGTPEELARVASANDNSLKLASGTEIPSPEARVGFDTYTVELAAAYDLTVTEMADLMGPEAERRTVLGHPAVVYSDRTLSISLSGEGADTGPGSITRRLLVSRAVKDGSGSFEVVVWREDGTMPDEAALLRVAESVLPTVPGWTAG